MIKKGLCPQGRFLHKMSKFNLKSIVQMASIIAFFLDLVPESIIAAVWKVINLTFIIAWILWYSFCIIQSFLILLKFFLFKIIFIFLVYSLFLLLSFSFHLIKLITFLLKIVENLTCFLYHLFIINFYSSIAAPRIIKFLQAQLFLAFISI